MASYITASDNQRSALEQLESGNQEASEFVIDMGNAISPSDETPSSVRDQMRQPLHSNSPTVATGQKAVAAKHQKESAHVDNGTPLWAQQMQTQLQTEMKILQKQLELFQTQMKAEMHQFQGQMNSQMQQTRRLTQMEIKKLCQLGA